MVRVRFAPSPTGHLHIGGLRAALFNWLFARRNGGKYLLRIEDTDLVRSTAEYQQSIIDAFTWLNIVSDEPFVIQSHRQQEHKELAQRLLADGKAYKCFCTSEELNKRLGITGDEIGERKYDGFCRQRTDTPQDQPFAIRFKIPQLTGEFAFQDLIRDRVTIPMDQFDDFVIVRSDGTPMYNFVVVADDNFMNITHVIRGEEHIINTPKQIWLYQACGWAVPQFAHLPLILGPSGAKLSKREAATSVLDYKRQGYLPDALINYLVRLGWSHGDQEIFSRQELCELFDLSAIGKKGAIFDIAKLNWLNNHYLKQLKPADIMARIEHDVIPGWLHQLSHMTSDQVETLIALYVSRCDTMMQLAHQLISLAQDPKDFDEKQVKELVSSEVVQLLEKLTEQLHVVTPELWQLEHITALMKNFAKEHAVQLPMIANPVRLALLGTINSPSIFAIVTALGQTKVVNRLEIFSKYVKSLSHHPALTGGY